MGIQESYYGTSRIAVEKCNFWGIGAYDGSAYESAKTFSNISEGIEYLCTDILNKYTQEGNWQYNNIVNAGYDPTTIDGVCYLYATDGSKATQVKKIMGEIFGWTDSSPFLAIAKSVWQQVCDRFTTYGGTNIVPTGTQIDCSSYVSWVLYEYGYTEFEGTQTNTETFYNTNWNNKYGWTEISVGSNENPIDKIQPGDLFVRFGGGTHHITLVVKVENGRVYGYDCGDSAHWLGKNGDLYDSTWFFTSTTGDGKIIRVIAPN